MSSDSMRFSDELSKKDKRIPPPDINYNQPASVGIQDYLDGFKRNACLKLLPFLIKCAGLRSDSVMFDYGCGLGRLAYAASHYLQKTGAYYGYEPNQTALAFLKSAYNDLANFRFAGDELKKQDDYVAVKLGREADAGASAQDVRFVDFIDRPVDVQFSSSVFTHMWRDPIVSVLKQCSYALAPGGVCVNTWLMIDDFAAYALRCGVADRALPFKINGAWTYLEQNPLMCTAYELPDIEKMYAAADHKIEQILPGSWSGRENGISYQDVILSRPC